MVEGHSVHRVATMHRQRLIGKTFVATSPNGRFTEGAKAIDGKVFYRIEAVGKNLFAFFRTSEEDENPVVGTFDPNFMATITFCVQYLTQTPPAVHSACPFRNGR